jgi:hypothetical protein
MMTDDQHKRRRNDWCTEGRRALLGDRFGDDDESDDATTADEQGDASHFVPLATASKVLFPGKTGGYCGALESLW